MLSLRQAKKLAFEAMSRASTKLLIFQLRVCKLIPFEKLRNCDEKNMLGRTLNKTKKMHIMYVNSKNLPRQILLCVMTVLLSRHSVVTI